MCGRMKRIRAIESVGKDFKVDHYSEGLDLGQFTKKDMFPGEPVLALVEDGNFETELTSFTWGFHPLFGNDERRIINARSETVFQKKMFKDHMMTRRCLLISSGFFEKNDKTGDRFVFHRRDNSLISIAGIYNKDGECSVLTAKPNSLVKPIHKRMPLVIESHNRSRWLDSLETKMQDVITMMQPWGFSDMVREAA